MNERVHKLSLVENSHSFMREAVKNAIAAKDDVSQWSFAILNLVQAVELSLKELLRRQHPVLIYENIDNIKNTVSITQALSRIESPHILGIKIPEEEKKKIKNAIELRNQITHFEFEISEKHAMAKFSEIFAFLVYFQGRHLNTEIENIIDKNLLQAVIDIEKFFSELKTKALQRIEDKKISPEWIWECPYCGEYTFVIEDSQNICYLCRQTEEIIDCPYCERPWFSQDMIDFYDLMEFDYCEGINYLVNSYDYSENKAYACPECIEKIRDDIEEKKAEEHYRNMEREWYYK